MQQFQVVTYGIAASLVERLRELAQTGRFWLRETSQFNALENLVQTSPPSVLVMMLGRDLERELTFLEQVHTNLPETAMIIVGDADHPFLAGLAWELGATLVVFPPTPMERIVEVVLGFLPVAKP